MPDAIRPAIPPDAVPAVKAWNLMGGLDWAALPVVAEIFGVTEIDVFVHQLVAIRDRQRGE